ncbi:MAG: four helix bundle protein [Desulfobacterales bacterium]|nr:four helix bundle protein [Desulfobacterales bacterium]
MNPKLKTFEDLKCWQACRDLRLFVAKEVLPALPGNEKYRLSDQILRAARSTTANLSEGFGRFHYMDNAKFCSNSRGSSYEVLDHLITAYDEDLLSSEMLEKGRKLVDSAVKLINGYMRYLKNPVKQPMAVREDISIYKITTPSDNTDF